MRLFQPSTWETNWLHSKASVPSIFWLKQTENALNSLKFGEKTSTFLSGHSPKASNKFGTFNASVGSSQTKIIFLSIMNTVFSLIEYLIYSKGFRLKMGVLLKRGILF